jgi:hypothetical protein
MDFISDDQMRGLSDDPQEAFLQFEKLARDWLNEQLSSMGEDESSSFYTLKYLNAVITAARQYEIGVIAEWAFVQPASHSSADYRRFIAEVDVCTLEIRMQRALHVKRNSVLLDPATKLTMTHWLQQMREAVLKAGLPVGKKDRLLVLINAMQTEIDLDRTPMQTIGELWMTACGYFGEGFKKLEPAIRAVERIGGALGLAKESEQPKQIEGPKLKQLPPPKAKSAKGGFDKAFDDEIPF